jgi:hypothetical protein
MEACHMRKSKEKPFCANPKCINGKWENGEFIRARVPRITQQCCSRDCASIIMEGPMDPIKKEKIHGKRVLKMYNLVCQNRLCQKHFKSRFSHRKFCSEACNAANLKVVLKGRVFRYGPDGSRISKYGAAFK